MWKECVGEVTVTMTFGKYVQFTKLDIFPSFSKNPLM